MAKYMHNDGHQHQHQHQEPRYDDEAEQHSDSVNVTETVSESDHHVDDGSYAQYHRHSEQYEEEERRRRTYDSNLITDPNDGNTSLPPSTLVRAANRESATTTNSFDQVADEIEGDMDVFDPAEGQGVSQPEPIPDRHQDRIFSEVEPTRNDEEDSMSLGQTVHEEHEEEHLVEEHMELHEHVHHERHEHHHYHEEAAGGGDGDDPDDEDDGEATERGLPHNRDERSSAGDTLPTMPGPPPSFSIRGERLSRNVGEALANVWDRFWAEDVRAITKIVRNRFSQLMPYIRRFLAHVVAFWGGITYIRRAIAAFVRLLKRDERVRELLERVGWASATTFKVFLSMCTMVFQATLQMYYLMRDRVIPDARRVVPILYYKAIMRLLMLAQRSPWALVLGPFSLTFAIDSAKVPCRYWLHDKLSVPRDDVTFASMQDLVQTVRESVYRTRYPTQRGGCGEEEHTQVEEQEEVYERHEEVYEAEHGYEEETSVRGEETEDSTQVYTQTTDETPLPPPSNYSGKRHVAGSRRSTGYEKENCGRPLSERTNAKRCEHAHEHEYHSADVISHGRGADRTGNTISRY